MIVKIIDPSQTYLLRHLVLWPHKSINECFIDVDDIGVHFGCYLNNEIISIGSFFEMKNEFFSNGLIQFRLRAMATNLNYNGMGAGSLIIINAIKYLKKKYNIDIIWCDARENAIGFYKKLGFKLIKGPYEIPIIGKHYLMCMNI